MERLNSLISLFIFLQWFLNVYGLVSWLQLIHSIHHKYCLASVAKSFQDSFEVNIKNYTQIQDTKCANFTVVLKNNGLSDMYLQLYKTSRDFEIFSVVKISVNDDLNYRTVVIKIFNFFEKSAQGMFNIFHQQLLKHGTWFTKFPAEPVNFSV